MSAPTVVSTGRVPFVDLRPQLHDIGDDVLGSIAAVAGAGGFVLGEEVERFEEAFAAALGARHCVGVGNGTDAIELILRACGVGPGDEVVMPAHTFVGTALGAVRMGAVPVFVDIDPTTMLVDLDEVASRVGPRTKAVVAVDLYGQMVALDELRLPGPVAVVEDACQAHGATRFGDGPGTYATGAAFSFYPTKNLGAWGDGGAVVTRDDALAAKVRSLRAYGGSTRYVSDEAGVNSRLDTIQAAVLLAKLPWLEQWNERRRAAAARYDELLDGTDGVTRLRTRPGNTHVFHLYVVRVDDRDRVRDRMAAAGVETGAHYPVPLHLQPALRRYGYAAGDFPRSEEAARSVLCLPMFAGITPAQQDQAVAALAGALRP